MTTIIHTQVIENYGLEDGYNYWKAKGGNVYLIEGTDNRQWNAVAMVNKIIQEHFGADNAYCQEYISNVEVSDDPYNVIDEYGDVPIHLTFKRDICDVRFADSSIVGRYNEPL